MLRYCTSYMRSTTAHAPVYVASVHACRRAFPLYFRRDPYLHLEKLPSLRCFCHHPSHRYKRLHHHESVRRAEADSNSYLLPSLGAIGFMRLLAYRSDYALQEACYSPHLVGTHRMITLAKSDRVLLDNTRFGRDVQALFSISSCTCTVSCRTRLTEVSSYQPYGQLS